MMVISTGMLNTIMPTEIGNNIALSRLFQLISPSLPIGGYTYSQGIEWAVEQGWIKSEQDVKEWLSGLLESIILYQELPVLIRMMRAWSDSDEESIAYWNRWLIASRETHELRQEESNRARAFTQVLVSLDESALTVKPLLLQTQSACFSYACNQWQISEQDACNGFVWGWLENLVLSAVKIIPLGQTAGQRLIFNLSEKLPGVIQQAMQLPEQEIGCSSMAMSIASAQHETQYTRLFRS